MEDLDGKMTQEKFSTLNAELINLEMLQSLDFQPEREQKIKALKKELGVED